VPVDRLDDQDGLMGLGQGEHFAVGHPEATEVVEREQLMTI
jgi:hypothetical protein